MEQADDRSQDRGPGPARLAGSRHEAGKEAATTSYWRCTRAWVQLGPEHETQQRLCTQYGVILGMLWKDRETTDDTSSLPQSPHPRTRGDPQKSHVNGPEDRRIVGSEDMRIERS
jgi:hypothetical protein